MRAMIVGIKPEVKLVLFHGEAIVKRMARGAGGDAFVAPDGFADHIFL